MSHSRRLYTTLPGLYGQLRITQEITFIKCQNLGYAIRTHERGNPCVVYCFPLDIMSRYQRLPPLKNVVWFWKNSKHLLEPLEF